MHYTVQISNGAELQDRFKDFDRGEQYSPAGFDALYEYLDGAGVGEVDVVGICCEFSEMEATEFIDSFADEDDLRAYAEEKLEPGLAGAEDVRGILRAADLMELVEWMVDNDAAGLSRVTVCAVLPGEGTVLVAE